MKSALLVLAVLSLLYARGVDSLPNGAPSAACDILAPIQNPSGHAQPPQTSAVPYMIDLSPFNNSGVIHCLQYTPGERYTRKQLALHYYDCP